MEHLLAQEIRRLLPQATVEPDRGGVELWTNRNGLWTLAHWSRLTEDLRLRIGKFRALDFNALERGLKKLPWSAHLQRDSVPEVRVRCRRSRLYHSDAVAERALAAIRDRLKGGRSQSKAKKDDNHGGDGSSNAPQPRVHLRLVDNKVRASIELIGEEGLFRRGRRSRVGRAPLRETLAAACLEAAELDPTQPLWDPFCGSGTFLIERAETLLGRPAVSRRDFAFLSSPLHDAEAYDRWLSNQEAGMDGSKVIAPIWGSDIADNEIDAARGNIESADLLERISLECLDFRKAAEHRGPTAIVTNLPWGKRSKGRDLVMHGLSSLLSERKDLDPVFVLTRSRRRIQGLGGMRWQPVLRFDNRGIPVVLLRLNRRGGPAGP